ncbi:2Fe-2S iron-sulfur cluster-binding protein [Streptomyces kronopolitis]|uniref:2Fe-2S iron-sulfur cluster-binding protein n=1 Tax=Streptomyces kronopolitis TaxID=1612435 RepID=UPI0036B228A7
MSDADNRHPYQPHPEQGWQPLPQGGEYESEATAFVQLPEGFTSGIYEGRAPQYGSPGTEPLAAPGHGYTPPSSFTPHAGRPPAPAAGDDPAATGQWTMPFADPSAGYADPSAGYPAHEQAAHQGHSAAYHSGAPEAAPPWGERVDWPVAGSPEAGGTGTWSVPAAADDGLEESGEYLLGDDEFTGHTGHSGGYPGAHAHPGHPVHPGHPGTGGATGYQGGGYPGGYDGTGNPAEAEEAGRTGHWNFTTGADAAHGTAAHPAPPQEPAHGAEPHDPYGVPAGDPYARERGLAGHGADPELPGGGDPYATGGGLRPAAGEATGHWSLPADALAQWPPAAEAPEPQDAAPQRQEAAERPDAAADMPDMPGTGGWPAPEADGEPPRDPAEFAPAGDPVGSAAPGDGGAAQDAPQAPAEATARPGAHPEPDDRADAEDGAATGDAPAADDRTTDGTTDAHPDATTGEGHPAADTDAFAVAPAAPAPDPGPDSHESHESHDVQESHDPQDEHPAASFVLRVNGIDRPVTDAWIGESLLYVLRERLGLAGAKDGCSQGECGACSVQVDGRLVASCLVPAATAAGSEVRTVEGLAQNGVPSDVQRALAASGAVQCGFCVPGMAMTVHDLLEGNHAPSELETRKALCGNLCRCSGYRGVLDAVEEVVKARAEAADDETDGDAPADTARIPHQAGPADPTGHAPHHQDPHSGGSA